MPSLLSIGGRFRLPAVLGLVLLSLPVRAAAQPSASSALWGTLGVPGTPAALAWAAGLNAEARSITPEWVMFEAIRALHGEPDSPRLRSFEGYVRLLGRFDATRRALGPELSLAMAGQRETREALEDFLQTCGLTLASGPRVNGTRARPPIVARRTDGSGVNDHAVLVAAGVALEGLEDRLNAGETVPAEALALPWFDVPMPLYDEWWQAVVGPDGNRSSAILTSRRAALVYYGASSLDAETRAYLANQPGLVTLLLERAAPFAAYGGNLRVRGGRIDVPGGQDAEAWWEALVGAPVSAPDRFIARVLESRSGRLAYFYSLLDSLSPARLRFVIGLSTPPAVRPDDVFAWFDRAEPGFDPERRPFSRPFSDPTPFVTGVRVDGAGRPAGPAWRYLWDAIFDDLRILQDTARALRPSDAVVDAPYFLNAIFGAGNVDPRVRMNTVLFAQRVFADAPQESAGDLLVALRGFQRFPMLALTLERAGVRSPAVYRAAVRMADALSAIPTQEHALASLSQYQGALNLIALAARTRKIDGDRAGALIESLSLVPLDRNGSFGGDIARWIDVILLPAVSTALPAGGATPVERAALAGLAHLPEPVDTADPRARGPEFEWQAWRYHVDASRALFARVSAVRQRQAGNSLDAVLKLSRATAALSGDITLETIAAERQLLMDLPGELREPQLPSAMEGARRLEVASVLRAAAEDLAEITDARRLNRVERVAARLHALTAALTADLLRAMSYAVNIPDPQSTLLSAGDVSHQHDLGVTSREPAAREGTAWGLPERTQGGPGSVRVRGSLLGLDLAMADLALGQSFLDRFAPPAHLTFEDLRIYVQPLALFNPFDERLHDVKPLGSALATGRARLSTSPADPSLSRLLRDAGVSPLRRELVILAVESNQAWAESLLSMIELVRLGSEAHEAASEAATHIAEAWGASSLVLDGCLCLTNEPIIPWEHYGGRGGVWGFLGARSPDLLLRVAEGLEQIDVPPQVAADILPMAISTLLDRAALAHEDDWLALTRASVFAPAEIPSFVDVVTSGRSLFPSQGR